MVTVKFITGKYEVTGIKYLADGTPAAGTIVKMYYLNDNTFIDSTVLDKTGYFKFVFDRADIADGKYELRYTGISIRQDQISEMFDIASPAFYYDLRIEGGSAISYDALGMNPTTSGTNVYSAYLYEDGVQISADTFSWSAEGHLDGTAVATTESTFAPTQLATYNPLLNTFVRVTVGKGKYTASQMLPITVTKTINPDDFYSMVIESGIRSITYDASGNNPTPDPADSPFVGILYFNGVPQEPDSWEWQCTGHYTGTSTTSSFTPSIIGTGYDKTLNTTVTAVAHVGTNQIAQTMPIVVLKEGLQGTDGRPLSYEGDYTGNMTLFYTANRRSIVTIESGVTPHYLVFNGAPIGTTFQNTRNAYFGTSGIDISPLISGNTLWAVSGISGWYTPESNDSYYWEEMPYFKSIATGLLLTEDAVITNTLTMGKSGHAGQIKTHAFDTPGTAGFRFGYDGGSGYSFELKDAEDRKVLIESGILTIVGAIRQRSPGITLTDYSGRGDWNSATQYYIGDLVQYGTPVNTYECIVAPTGSAPWSNPTVAVSNWRLFAAAGQDGSSSIGLDITASNGIIFKTTTSGIQAPGSIDSTQLRANHIGIGSATYQWAKLISGSYSNIGGATANVFTVNYADLDQVESITYNVTASGTSVLTDSITLLRLKDGTDSLIGVLTNESHTVVGNAAGTVSDFTGAGGQFNLYFGSTDVTASATYSKISETHVTGSINASTGVYSITAMDSSYDTGSMVLRATYTYGGITQVRDKTFSVSKAKTGAAGANGTAGANAKLISLASTAQAFTYNGDNSPVPTGQVITFTASGQNLTTSTITWDAYNAAGTQISPITLALSAATGTSVTMTEAQFRALNTSAVRVKAYHATDLVNDSTTVVKLKDGQDSLVGYLTNGAVVLPASVAGVVASPAGYVGASGVFAVYKGLTNITGSGVYSLIAQTGTATFNINAAGQYNITAIDNSTDTASATFRCTYSGQNIDQVFTATKSKTGASGADGADGATGAAGPGVTYRGDYDAAKIYFGTSLRRDVVKYSSNYYVAKLVGGDIGFSNHSPADTSYWEAFGAQFSSVATDILLANDAAITRSLVMGADAPGSNIGTIRTVGTANAFEQENGYLDKSGYFAGPKSTTDTNAVFRVGTVSGMSLTKGILWDGTEAFLKSSGMLITTSGAQDWVNLVGGSSYNTLSQYDFASDVEGFVTTSGFYHSPDYSGSLKASATWNPADFYNMTGAYKTDIATGASSNNPKYLTFKITGRIDFTGTMPTAGPPAIIAILVSNNTYTTNLGYSTVNLITVSGTQEYVFNQESTGYVSFTTTESTIRLDILGVMYFTNTAGNTAVFYITNVDLLEYQPYTELSKDGLIVFNNPKNYLKVGNGGFELKGQDIEANNVFINKDLTILGNVISFGATYSAATDIAGTKSNWFYLNSDGTGEASSLYFDSTTTAGISYDGSTKFTFGKQIWYDATNNSVNWGTAYTDRLKWDGGSTGTNVSTARTTLGLGTADSPSFTGVTLTGLTASRLMASNGSKALASVSDLTSWIAGTTNQITVTNDGDGSVTLSLPQNIHTSATPGFTQVTLSGDGSGTTNAVRAGRAITIAGTTDQITSSAGSQNLTADRTWTLSLPQSIATTSSPSFAGLTISKNSGGVASAYPVLNISDAYTSAGTASAGIKLIRANTNSRDFALSNYQGKLLLEYDTDMSTKVLGSGTASVTIDGSSVGIGTTSPNWRTHIVETSAGAATVPMVLHNVSSTDGTTVSLGLSAAGSNTITGQLLNTRVGSSNYRTDILNYYNSLTAGLSLYQGRVGIGITAPTGVLDVYTTAAETGTIRFRVPTLQEARLDFYRTDAHVSMRLAVTNGSVIQFYNNNDTSTLKLGINTNGTVELGAQATATTHAVRADRALIFTSETNVTITNSASAQNLTSDRSWALGWTGVLSMLRGGTGASLVGVSGALVYSTNSTVMGQLSPGNAGQVLKTNGAGAAPSWYAPTQYNIIYAGASGALADDASFTWNGSTLNVDNSGSGLVHTNRLKTVSAGTASSVAIALNNSDSSGFYGGSGSINSVNTAGVFAAVNGGAAVILTSGSLASATGYNSGFTGSGWRVDQGVTIPSESYAEFDNLTIRGTMRVYELLIQQIRATNGSLFVSSSAKVLTSGNSVTGSAPTETVTFEDPSGHNVVPFLTGDIVLCQRVKISGNTGNSGDIIKRVVRRVNTINGKTVTFIAASGYAGDTGSIEPGDDFVRIGSETNVTRQGSIYLTSDDAAAPYIDIVDGVDSWANWKSFNKLKARLGKLTGVVSPTMGALTGFGLYSQNAYLEGNASITGNLSVAGGSSKVAGTFYAGKILTNYIPNSSSVSTVSGIWNYGGANSEFEGRLTVTKANVPVVSGGQWYTMSCDVRATAGYDPASPIKIGASFELSSTYSYSRPNNTDGNFCNYYPVYNRSGCLTVSGEWQRLVFYGMYNSSYPEQPNLYFYHGKQDTTYTLEIKNIQFEVGKVTTPYQKTDATITSDTGYGVWMIAGGAGGTMQNPVVSFNDAGLKVRNAGVTYATAIGANEIAIGNYTGTAASAIKLANTGTNSTGGLFGYDSTGAQSFKIALDGTAQIGGFWFDNADLYNNSVKASATTYISSGKISLGTSASALTATNASRGIVLDAVEGFKAYYNDTNYVALVANNGNGITNGLYINANNFSLVASGLKINSTTPESTVYKNISTDYVKTHYTGSSDWGIEGKVSSSLVFQLGSTNQIANWVFDSSTLKSANNTIFLKSSNLSTVVASGIIGLGLWTTTRPTLRVYGPNTSGYIDMFYGSSTDWGLKGKNTAGAEVFSLGYSNQIAGWVYDTLSLSKTSGSSIIKLSSALATSVNEVNAPQIALYDTSTGLNVSLGLTRFGDDEDGVNDTSLFGIAISNGLSEVPFLMAKNIGSSSVIVPGIGTITAGSTILNIAGFTFDTSKLYSYLSGTAGIEIDAGNRRVIISKDANNYLKSYYTSSSDWGIKGVVNTSGIFQLGSTNQIAGFTFDNTGLYKTNGSNTVRLDASTAFTGLKLTSSGKDLIKIGDYTYSAPVENYIDSSTTYLPVPFESFNSSSQIKLSGTYDITKMNITSNDADPEFGPSTTNYIAYGQHITMTEKQAAIVIVPIANSSGSVVIDQNFIDVTNLKGRKIVFKYKATTEPDYGLEDEIRVTARIYGYDTSNTYSTGLIAYEGHTFSNSLSEQTFISSGITFTIPYSVSELRLSIAVGWGAQMTYYSCPTLYIGDISIETVEDTYLNIAPNRFELFNTSSNYIRFTNSNIDMNVANIKIGGNEICRYLGAFDNDNIPSVQLYPAGSTYKNTTNSKIYFSDGTSWIALN